MRSKTAVIGPTTYKTFRKELLLLILGQPPRDLITARTSAPASNDMAQTTDSTCMSECPISIRPRTL